MKTPKKKTGTAEKPAAAAPPIDDIQSELAVEPSLADKVAVLKGVETALTLMKRITVGEELLKTLKSDLNDMQTNTLPKLLAQAGTSLFKISEGPYVGYEIESKPFVAGSLPKVTSKDDEEKAADKRAKRQRGLDFIRECGAEDIIKTVMEVTIDKGQDNLLGELKSFVEEHGFAYEVSSEVHHATLGSFAKERLKKGENVPFEDLGLYAGTIAKITPPKD